MVDRTCWYSVETSFHVEFKYEVVILILYHLCRMMEEHGRPNSHFVDFEKNGENIRNCVQAGIKQRNMITLFA